MSTAGIWLEVDETGAVAAAVDRHREPEDVAFPLRFDRKAACAYGYCFAVHLVRQLVIVAGSDHKLHCYNLGDGMECSVLGRGPGAGDMQFDWNRSGVCVTPGGTLLVADCLNHRVPEVDLDALHRFVRVFGRGDGAPQIKYPLFVDCNDVHVAVSEEGANRVSVLSYADGSLVGRVGSAGPKPFSDPSGIKLLADGSGVVVADYGNHRVVLLSLAGNLVDTAPLVVQSYADLRFPVGLVQCVASDGDVAVVVACKGAANRCTRLTKVSFHHGVLESVDMPGSTEGLFCRLADIATLPGGGLVALDNVARHFQVFTSLTLSMGWIGLVMSWQRRH